MSLKHLLTIGSSPFLSASQLWFHIANSAVTAVYLYLGIKIGIHIGIDANDAQMIDSFTWLTLVYAGIVTGNKFANTLANLKFGGNNDNSTKSTKQVLETTTTNTTDNSTAISRV